jgi:hypothetical protein
VRNENGEPTFEDGDYEYWNSHNYDVRDQAAVDYGDHSNGLTRAQGLHYQLNTPKEEREYYTDDLGRSIMEPYRGKHWLPGQGDDKDVEYIDGRRPMPGKDGMSYPEIMELMKGQRGAKRGGQGKG